MLDRDPQPPRFQFSSSTPDPLDFRSSSPAVREHMAFHPISPMSEDGPGGRDVVPRCPALGWGACTVASCAGLMQVVWSIMIAEAYHASAPLSQVSHSSKASHGRVFDPSFLQCCNAQLDQACSLAQFVMLVTRLCISALAVLLRLKSCSVLVTGGCKASSI